MFKYTLTVKTTISKMKQKENDQEPWSNLRYKVSNPNIVKPR